MRLRFIACALVLVGLSAAEQTHATNESIQLPEGVTIPVLLKTTLDTAKLKQGDKVKFELLGPVLAGHAVVLPANAKLMGHVVGATPLGTTTMSSLAVVVDTAEWKHQSVTVTAYIAGFGWMSRLIILGSAKCDQELTESAPRQESRRSGETGRVLPAPNPTRGFDSPRCDVMGPRIRTDLKPVEHIKLRKTGWKDVPVLMVSAEKTIVLKKGQLLVIRSGEAPATAGSAWAGKTTHP